MGLQDDIYGGCATSRKILKHVLWWLTIHGDATDYAKSYNVYQITGKPSQRDEMSLIPQVTLQPFKKWASYFLGPINPLGKRTGSRYIITVTDYLSRWDEAAPVKDCRTAAVARFLFDNVVTRFGCPKILMSDQGYHFVNQTIIAITEEFQIHHKRSTPYHPQANGAVETFNKILENALNKVCDANQDDWNLKILAILWAYKTTCKILANQTPFKLVYGKEAVMPMEYIIPILCLVAVT